MLEVNKIYNADCLELMKQLPDKCIDLVLTDPAYFVTSRGNAGNSGGMLQKDINMSGKVFKENHLHISEWLPDVYRILKDDTHCYIMTNHVNLFDFLVNAKKVGFHFIKSLIWDKGNKIMGQAYMSQFEYILFFRKGAFKMINDCGCSDIVPIYNKKTRWNGENIHDTEKPVKLMEYLIKNSSKNGDIVIDPFGGSCPVAIACHNLNRSFICIEKDYDYWKASVERLENAQAQQKLF